MSTYAKACGAQGLSGRDPRASSSQAFKAALASGKPTLIDAVITRLAIPHYSPNPAGLSAALAEAVAKQLNRASRRSNRQRGG